MWRPEVMQGFMRALVGRPQSLIGYLNTECREQLINPEEAKTF